MKILKQLFMFTLCTVLAFGVASAKKKPAGIEKANRISCPVYIFGVAQNFNDSTVYVTTINRIDSLGLEKKTRFLPYRSELSLQVKEYVEGTLGHTKMTCSVFYASNQAVLSKQLYKVKKTVLDDSERRLVILTSDMFRFQNPETRNQEELKEPIDAAKTAK